MLAYTLRRLLQFIPTIIAITLLVFVLLNVLPGNAALMAGGKQRLSQEAQERLVKKWGLDQPLHVRYWNYLTGLVRGEMGESYFSREDVGKMLLPRLWPTFKLALSALFIACLLGIPLGFYSALHQGSWVDSVTMVGAVSGVSMPQFWLGLLLMYLFSVKLGVLPTFGYGDGKAVNLILPAVTLGVGYMALLARTTRAAVVEVLTQDYVRTARAKGLKSFLINRKHVFRNTLVLLLTSAGLQFGSLLGETVVVETLFSWPGIGSMLVNSIFYRDIPVTQGCIVVIISAFLLINLIVDLLYAVIDPRIKYS
jgi:ABC-type dipeptide/oligopeptide/nickel transport system permease component